MQGTFTPAKDTDILIVRFDFDFAIISLKGVVTSSDNIDWSIPNYYGLATEYWCDVYQRGRGLFINGGEKYENSPFHLIIEYIKK